MQEQVSPQNSAVAQWGEENLHGCKENSLLEKSARPPKWEVREEW